MSPVFMLQPKTQGSLYRQAERKVSPSTLIPDVDNAAVGNAVALLQEDTHRGDSPVFSYLLREEETETTCVAG